MACTWYFYGSNCSSWKPSIWYQYWKGSMKIQMENCNLNWFICRIRRVVHTINARVSVRSRCVPPFRSVLAPDDIAIVLTVLRLLRIWLLIIWIRLRKKRNTRLKFLVLNLLVLVSRVVRSYCSPEENLLLSSAFRIRWLNLRCILKPDYRLIKRF